MGTNGWDYSAILGSRPTASEDRTVLWMKYCITSGLESRGPGFKSDWTKTWQLTIQSMHQSFEELENHVPESKLSACTLTNSIYRPFALSVFHIKMA